MALPPRNRGQVTGETVIFALDAICASAELGALAADAHTWPHYVRMAKRTCTGGAAVMLVHALVFGNLLARNPGFLFVTRRGGGTLLAPIPERLCARVFFCRLALSLFPRPCPRLSTLEDPRYSEKLR